MTVAVAEAAAEVHPADLTPAAVAEVTAEGLGEQGATDPLSLPPLPPPAIQQVWSLTQFYCVDLSQSRIGVKVRFQQTHN